MRLTGTQLKKVVKPMKRMIVILLSVCMLCTSYGTLAESNADPIDSQLLSILESIRDDYHPGTAGCSLTATRLAAEIMDWYITLGNTNIAVLTMRSIDTTQASFDDIDYSEKLMDIYEAAISLYGESGRMRIDDCGYEPVAYPYTMSAVKEVFDGLFTGLGVQLPCYIRLFIPHENAEYVIATAYKAESLAPETIVAALIEYGVLNPDVAVNSMDSTFEMLYLDMNAAFGDQMCSLGTAGEYMLISALTESFMDNFGVNRILVTVNGEMLETGHVEYDVIERSDPLADDADKGPQTNHSINRTRYVIKPHGTVHHPRR